MHEEGEFETLRQKLIADLQAQVSELQLFSYNDMLDSEKRVILIQSRNKAVQSATEFADFLNKRYSNSKSYSRRNS